jgi:hypothetical protein
LDFRRAEESGTINSFLFMNTKQIYTALSTANPVDESAGTIRQVSVITTGPALGHGVEVDAKTLEQVKSCAAAAGGTVKCKEDHGTGVTAIVGALKGFAIVGKQLLADLHLIKSHERFRTIVEMAKSIPGAFGLSITFDMGTEEINGTKFLRVNKLYSVDLVSDPAANPGGLFSRPSVLSQVQSIFANAAGIDAIDAFEAAFGSDQLETVARNFGNNEVAIERHCAKALCRHGLSYPGQCQALDTPLNLTGMARVERGMQQERIDALLLPAPAVKPPAKAKPGLTGLARAISAHQASLEQK